MNYVNWLHLTGSWFGVTSFLAVAKSRNASINLGKSREEQIMWPQARPCIQVLIINYFFFPHKFKLQAFVIKTKYLHENILWELAPSKPFKES